MNKYSIEVRDKEGNKQVGFYEYPQSMNVRKFWLGFCRRNGLTLLKVGKYE